MSTPYNRAIQTQAARIAARPKSKTLHLTTGERLRVDLFATYTGVEVIEKIKLVQAHDFILVFRDIMPIISAINEAEKIIAVVLSNHDRPPDVLAHMFSNTEARLQYLSEYLIEYGDYLGEEERQAANLPAFCQSIEAVSTALRQAIKFNNTQPLRLCADNYGGLLVQQLIRRLQTLHQMRYENVGRKPGPSDWGRIAGALFGRYKDRHPGAKPPDVYRAIRAELEVSKKHGEVLEQMKYWETTEQQSKRVRYHFKQHTGVSWQDWERAYWAEIDQ